jgi:hypothetical protein
MYSEKLEKLIEYALADGVLTEKERQALNKAAEAEGVDLDEFEVVLEARLYEKTQLRVENPGADEQNRSDNSTSGFKQKLLNSISSKSELWKILVIAVIAVVIIFFILKMFMSWILSMVIWLGIFGVLIYAIRSGSNIFSSFNKDNDDD